MPGRSVFVNTAGLHGGVGEELKRGEEEEDTPRL